MQRSWLAILGVVFTLFCMVLACWMLLVVECAASDVQHSITTKHTTLVFSAVEDVTAFNRAIDYGVRNSLSSIFSSPKLQDAERELARKVDLLFEKVQLILDMRKEMRKVRVRVFSNTDQLHAVFEKIYMKKCTVRGWYLYEFNTVFLNVKDVHEGMLAHELGHAIIDHFLEVRPPRATAEILAKYVDMHLHEEVKTY